MKHQPNNFVINQCLCCKDITNIPIPVSLIVTEKEEKDEINPYMMKRNTFDKIICYSCSIAYKNNSKFFECMTCEKIFPFMRKAYNCDDCITKFEAIAYINQDSSRPKIHDFGPRGNYSFKVSTISAAAHLGV